MIRATKIRKRDCEMAHWIFHSLFRMPLSVDGMKTLSAGHLNNLKWLKKIAPDEASFILRKKYSNGVSYLDQMKLQFNENIKAVASETTWGLQRKNLMRIAMHSYQMMAILNSVNNGYSEKVHIWEHLVKNNGHFINNDKKLWGEALLTQGTFSLVFVAIYAWFGARVYNISSHFDDAAFYKKLAQTVLERQFNMREKLTDASKSLSDELIEDFEEMFLEIKKEEFRLLDEMADDISNLKKIDRNLGNWKTYFKDLKHLREGLLSLPTKDEQENLP